MKRIEQRACNDMRLEIGRALSNLRSAQTRLEKAQPNLLALGDVLSGETEYATIVGLIRSAIRDLDHSERVLTDLCDTEDR